MSVAALASMASPLAFRATSGRIATPRRASKGAPARAAPWPARRRPLTPPPPAVAGFYSGPAPADDGVPSVEELKSMLLDTLYGTERGLAASSDTRAEVSELVAQLEGRNPTPAPNEAADLLSGTWRLVYTSNSELISLLALGRLPLLTVGEITQTVDGVAMTVENRIELQAPLSRTSLSATANFEVRSPQLLQVRFEQGRVATPELVGDLDLPSSIDVLGQSVDLSGLQAALRPLEGPLRGLVAQLGQLLSGAPDLSIPLSQVPGGASNSTWLLNTYLDSSLRITRGDQGSVYVLVKDAPGSTGGSSGGAVAGYYTGGGQPDWEAIEEQEPAGTAATPAAPVVEASAVIEGQGSNSNGSSAGAGASPASTDN